MAHWLTMLHECLNKPKIEAIIIIIVTVWVLMTLLITTKTIQQINQIDKQVLLQVRDKPMPKPNRGSMEY